MISSRSSPLPADLVHSTMCFSVFLCGRAPSAEVWTLSVGCGGSSPGGQCCQLKARWTTGSPPEHQTPLMQPSPSTSSGRCGGHLPQRGRLWGLTADGADLADKDRGIPTCRIGAQANSLPLWGRWREAPDEADGAASPAKLHRSAPQKAPPPGELSPQATERVARCISGHPHRSGSTFVKGLLNDYLDTKFLISNTTNHSRTYQRVSNSKSII